MKLILTCFIFLFVLNSLSAENTLPKTKKKPQVESAKKASFPTPPRLAKEEYAVFVDDAYRKFKTITFEDLELESTCLKNGKPTCQAYDFSQIKPKNYILKHESMNNMSAVHCEAAGGTNLVALDAKNNQYNFCKFHDGSLVNSWSMYYKHNPDEKSSK